MTAQRRERIALTFGTPVALLLLWEIVVRAADIDPIVLVPPSKVAVGLFELVRSGVLPKHLLVSTQTFVISFVAATILGVAFGLLNGWYRRLYHSFDLVLTALYTTPLIILLPLFIIWFGLGPTSQYVIVFIAAFFPIAFNTTAGVRALDQQLIRVGRSFGANDFDVFRGIALPAAVPFVLASLRLALGRGLTALIFAEWFGGQSGIGALIAIYGQTFQTGPLFAMIVLIIVVSLLLVEALKYAEGRYASLTGLSATQVVEK